MIIMSYIAIYNTTDEEWDLYKLNRETRNPTGDRVLGGEVSISCLIDVAEGYGIPAEAILGKARDVNVPCFE